MRAENISRNQVLQIRTNMTAAQVLGKLKRISTEEFYDAKNNPEYTYYGTITNKMFHLCNKKYGPYSSGPWIKGEVSESDNKTIVNLEADIEEQMDLSTKILYPVFIVFGVLAMAAGLMVPENRQMYAFVAVGLFVSPFAYNIVARRLLKSMQRDEVKQFEKLIGGWQVKYSSPGLEQPQHQGVTPGKN
ncbi:MAG: hypothetical protein HYX80_05280 [Chloroflexi bacterium]|nr:hypothetical protein [Chloroflexota bacterium]